MSRPIGAVFHLPHGLSNAILLPTVTAFSWESAIERYADVARALGCSSQTTSDQDACLTLLNYLQELNEFLELPGFPSAKMLFGKLLISRSKRWLAMPSLPAAPRIIRENPAKAKSSISTGKPGE